MAFGSLAELYVEVKPETSKFGRQLVRDLERRHRGRAIEIAVKPNTRRFTVEATRAAGRAGRSAGRSFHNEFRSAASGYSRGLDRGLKGVAGLGARVLGSAAKVAAVGVGAATAAVGVGLAKATQKAGAFDKTMRMAGQTMRASGGQLKNLTDLAIEMGAKTSFSASGAADAMYELAKGGMRSAQIRAGALKETLVLAAAGGLELGESAEFMVKTLGAFRLKARDAKRVSSALAGAANASSASVQDMGLALAQVSASAAANSQSVEETTAALAAFHNAGIRGSDAGTSLKTMLARLQPQTEKASGAMKELGIITEDGKNRFFDARGEMKPMAEIAGILEGALKGLSDQERIRAMNTIFGSDATRAATVLMNEGESGIRKYQKATEDQSQAAKLAKTATEGYAGAMERFKGAIESIQIIGGKAFLPGVTRSLNGISTWLGENQDELKTLFSVAASSLESFGEIAEGVFETFVGTLTGGKTDFHSFTEAIEQSQVEIIDWGIGVVEVFLNTTSTVSGFVSSFLDGLATMNEAAATTMDFFVPWMKIMRAISIAGGNFVGAKMWENLIEGSQGQSASFRDSAASTRGLADDLRNKLDPAANNALTRLRALRDTAIAKATAREQATRTAKAVRDIGSAADAAKGKVNLYNIVTGKGNAVQRGYAARVREARRETVKKYEAYVAAGYKGKRFAKVVKESEDALYKEFRQMKFSKEEARLLAQKYSQVPNKILTKADLDKKKADERRRELEKKLDALVKRKYNAKVGVNFDTSVDGKNTTATPGKWNPVTKRVGSISWANRDVGGYTGRVAPDVVTGFVHGDEHVIKSPSRRKFERKNPGVLEHINKTGELPGEGHQTGGVTSNFTRTRTRSVPAISAKVTPILGAYFKKWFESQGGVGHGSKKRVRWHGGTFTERFRNALQAAEKRHGQYFPVMQGGFRPATSYSGTSHRGDAVDTGWSTGRQSAMRASGIYAPHRTPAQGFSHHIHGIPKKGFGYPAGSGLWQQGDFARGGNGLKRGGSFQSAGWAKVGERGPELVRGNKGDKVTPLNQPISIRLDLGEDLRYYVEGLIDDNNKFVTSMSKLSR